MRLKKYKEQQRRWVDAERRRYPKKGASEEDQTAWSSLVASRNPTVFTDLPPVAQTTFAAAALIIRAVVPTAVLSVVGSFSKGTYLIGTDSTETARLREVNMHKIGLSDYDILVEGVGTVDESNFSGLASNVDIFSHEGFTKKIAIPTPLI